MRRAELARAGHHRATPHLEGVREGQIALAGLGDGVRRQQRDVVALHPRDVDSHPIGDGSNGLVLAPAVAHGIAHRHDHQLPVRRPLAQHARRAGEDRARVPSTAQPERGGAVLAEPLIDRSGEQRTQLFGAVVERGRTIDDRRLVPVLPKLHSAVASHRERVASGEHGDSQVARLIPDVEQGRDRRAERRDVDLAAVRRMPRHDRGERCDDQAVAVAAVVQRPDAGEVARRDQGAPLAIPHDERVVALEPLRTVASPCAVRVEDEVRRAVSAGRERPVRRRVANRAAQIVPVVDRRVGDDQPHAVVHHDGPRGGLVLPREAAARHAGSLRHARFDAFGAARRHVAHGALERVGGERCPAGHGEDRAHRRETFAGGGTCSRARAASCQSARSSGAPASPNSSQAPVARRSDALARRVRTA